MRPVWNTVRHPLPRLKLFLSIVTEGDVSKPLITGCAQRARTSAKYVRIFLFGAVKKQFTRRRGLTVRIKISSVTAWTGRMTAHVVWDWAADCSRLVVLRRQRSCLQNCRQLQCRGETWWRPLANQHISYHAVFGNKRWSQMHMRIRINTKI